ncbi:2-deoxy-d-gluconate 3-dehydrogenase [Lipomyces mesembrius]
MFSLEGKTVLVTGGIAEAGADIILIQRDTTRTETLHAIEAVGSKSIIVKCDLSNAEDVQALVKHITLDLGQAIDIFVNCGGIQRHHPAEYFPDEDWNEVLQVNLTTCFTLARDVGRHMLENMEKKPQGYRGKIINIASLASFQRGITVPAYAAAKHGILEMTKALSNGVGKGINVNAVAPGYIATEMNTALIANSTRWGAPDDFLRVLSFSGVSRK